MVADPSNPSERNKRHMVGFPDLPAPKTFHLHDGRTRTVPDLNDRDPDVKAEPMDRWPGSPLVPTGNGMVDGVGPAAYAMRPDEPEKTMHGGPRLLPMRVATEFSVASEDPDPRGMPVVGKDNRRAGEVTDLWVDRAEPHIRYLEVKADGAENTVLLPMGFSRISDRQVKVHSILASQFADVPTLKNPDQVTQREEDQISAYYGGGRLYATPESGEPIL
jgi:photosynthetic reaction center H subunit